MSIREIQDDFDPELLPLFLEEADELYPQLAEMLQAWREQPANSQLARKLQRSLHTFKGSARMAGAMRIGDLVHKLEGRVIEAGMPSGAFWAELQSGLERVGGMIEQLRGEVSADSCADDGLAQRAPFSCVSKRLYRIVRQTGKELGKRANLELQGTDIELERSVLEKMTAPFEHLLRNAIAHGLEDPQQREAAGKPPMGDIRLSLRRENGEAVFEFADDGAGLDIDALRRKAVAMGLLREDAQASDGQVMQMIFTPGVSTATEITAISGRGLGMDVVRSEIASLGGRISVLSKRGEGTSFIIRLPAAKTGNGAGTGKQNCEGSAQKVQ